MHYVVFMFRLFSKCIGHNAHFNSNIKLNCFDLRSEQILCSPFFNRLVLSDHKQEPYGQLQRSPSCAHLEALDTLPGEKDSFFIRDGSAP